MLEPSLFLGLLTYFLLNVVGGLSLLLTRHQRENMRDQQRLFLVSFALRFGMSIVIYQFNLVAVLGDEDASGWGWGLTLQEQWAQEGVGLFDIPTAWLRCFTQVNKGYHYFLATFFHLTHLTGRMPAAALNAYLGALTVVIVYRIARCLFDHRVAHLAAWWVCFFPSMIIWSSQTQKEPVIIFLESVAIYSCIALGKYGMSIRHVISCTMAMVMVYCFRFYVAYLCGLLYLISFLCGAVAVKKSLSEPVLAVGSLLILFAIFSQVSSQAQTELDGFGLDTVESFRGAVSSGEGARSGVATNFDLRTSQGMGLGLAVGAVHLLLAPFPWQLGGASLRMALTLPELLFWWWIFFRDVIPGIKNSIRTRFAEILPILVFIAGLGLLYSLMFGNIGIIFRQRAQLLPWLLIFGASGHFQRMDRNSGNPEWNGLPRMAR